MSTFCDFPPNIIFLKKQPFLDVGPTNHLLALRHFLRKKMTN